MKAEGGSLGHYNRLYTYSMGNLAFLLYQGVTPQPVANYQRWQEVGRHVKRGAKAFYILRPINVKLDELDDEGNPKTITRFKPVKSVFRLEDTDGEPLPELELPEWSRERMLGNLAIELASDFPTYNGNVQGLSEGRTIYINPVAKYPEKTFFHETSHCVHGHTEGDYSEYLAHRGIYEAEAEGSAHIVTNELGLLDDDAREESGAYIRHWLKDGQIPDRSIRRIFKVSDEILKAGRKPEIIEAQTNNPE